MNYIERAIKLAIEGEYDGSWFLYPRNTESKNVQRQLFLDKNFWVALGKQLNLGNFYDEEGSPKVYGLQGWYPPYGGDLENQMWAYEAMEFFQATLEGITPEEFFKELLKGE